MSRIPDGCYAGIDNTGEIRVIISYSNGMAHGKYCDYSKSGQLMTEGAYRFGHQEGEWRFYHRDGTLFDIIFFRNGIEIQSLGHLLAGKFVDQLSEEMIDAILHEKPDDKNEKND
ncbi:: MORN_2: MORN_2 [Tuwongella immobilis]|uniref:: MORN_2: MORN_2 n=1 Tax=Tuwongella immobilis TaxID=692036 RepID=A0A6C2YTH1_9BACT|nr:: MORN_2: MORN_2 [Tuwongella immobilis]VTS07413.1 : MORN_2: MORN_2 [Tuwongella immobilis]